MIFEKNFSLKNISSKIAFGGFVISLLTHLISILGVNLTQYFPFIWMLHLGIFFVFLPMCIFCLLEQRNLKDNAMRYDLITSIPRKFRYLVLFVFIYTIFNFILFLSQNYEGTPEIKDNKYVLVGNGREPNRKIIREIGKDEYNLKQAQGLAGFSALWLIILSHSNIIFWLFSQNRERIVLVSNRIIP